MLYNTTMKVKNKQAEDVRNSSKHVLTAITALVFASVLLASCSVDRKISSEDDLKDDQEQLSYSLGLFFGNQAKFFPDVDLALLQAGIRDAYTEKENIIYDEQRIGEIIISNQREILRTKGEEAEEKSSAYLDENSADERFTALESGVRYRVIEEGEGKKPAESDTVEVHYKGTLTNGEVFDSSYDRGEPAVFPLNGVIAGWREVLQLMPVGATWEVVIPPEHAYGEQGTGKIGPNEVLIFEINLIAIK